ncbi:MAG: hypothetical protein R3F59_36670 [Myxococcota bacterium]
MAPQPWPEVALDPAVARRWLQQPVYERLASSHAGFLAELRSAAALFVGFAVPDGADPLGWLDRFVRWVQREVDRRGGTVVQLTTGDKGAYL